MPHCTIHLSLYCSVPLLLCCTVHLPCRTVHLLLYCAVPLLSRTTAPLPYRKMCRVYRDYSAYLDLALGLVHPRHVPEGKRPVEVRGRRQLSRGADHILLSARTHTTSAVSTGSSYKGVPTVRSFNGNQCWMPMNGHNWSKTHYSYDYCSVL